MPPSPPDWFVIILDNLQHKNTQLHMNIEGKEIATAKKNRRKKPNKQKYIACLCSKVASKFLNWNKKQTLLLLNRAFTKTFPNSQFHI
jgi:hypothetical protein